MKDKKTKKDLKPAGDIKSYRKLIFVFTILIFVLVIIFIGVSLWQNGTVRNTIQLFKYKDSYQGVFLTSGQAYFGKITEINNEYIIMENAFSIKVQQAQADEEGETSSEIKLLSIEKEFYEPEDYMLIKKDSILFIEELKDSSQIVEAIENY